MANPWTQEYIADPAVPWTQEYIADPAVPWSAESVRRSPTVRVEYDEAIAFGDMGSCLAATRSKHWGDGPYIMPLGPDDFFYWDRITYQYRETSLYNRRFKQRQRMKELLGKRHRPLVESAKHFTKRRFLARLRGDEADAIRRIFNVEPGEFWRASKGRAFLSLPPRLVQQEFPFDEYDPYPCR